MLRPLAGCGGAVLVLLCAPQAWAAGGAHVVDDAGVETPGTCHFEVWTSRHGSDGGLVNLAPACTRHAWPNLELGGGLQHIWDGVDDTTLGPALKLLLREPGQGPGLALAASTGWSLRHDRVEAASVMAPVTLRLNDRARANVNVRWNYSRAGAHRSTAFAGVQAEVQLTETLGLMAEVFGRDHGRPGGQVGLRWTPRGQPFDVDLLAGRRIDGVTPSTVTLGLTLRR